MKSKNRFAILAGVITAFAAFMPFGASAGNVHRMDSTKSYPMSNPAHIGDEVTFRMLLANNSSNDTYDVAWNLKYIGSGSELFDRIVGNMPMIAIKISDSTHYAKLVNVSAYSTHLTQVDFSYVVTPGDLAKPMEVVFENGHLSLLNLGGTALWDIQDENGTSADLTTFVNGTDPVIDGVQYIANFNLTHEASTYGAGPVYISTLDFDSNYTENGYWREIPEKSEMANRVPRVVIDGVSTTNGTVYVWISDKTGTNVSTTVGFGDGMQTEVNGWGQKYYPMPIAIGDTEGTFTLRGLSRVGTDEAYIFLSSQPSNTIRTGGALVSNFTYRVVKVTEPLPPTIWFEIDNTEVFCSTNWQQHAATLTVNLSEAYTEDITVNLNMSNATHTTAAELFAAETIRVADTYNLPSLNDMSSSGQNNWMSTDVTVFIPKGKTTGTAYIYALGAEKDRIFFAPQIADNTARAYYRTLGEYCTIKLNPCSPIVKNVRDKLCRLVDPPTFALTEGRPYTFNIEVADGYSNITTNHPHYTGYTVEWTLVPGQDPVVVTNLSPVAFDDGGRGILVLPITVTYNDEGLYTNTLIRVTNSDGGQNGGGYPSRGEEPVTVQVGAAMRAYMIPDRALMRDKDRGDYTITNRAAMAYAEGETMRMAFYLSEKYRPATGSNDLFAFLEPLNEAASNSTTSANWAIAGTNELGEAVYGTEGIRIVGTESIDMALVTLGDGPGTDTPKFGLRLCNTRTFDPDKEVDAYVSDPMYVSVTNVAPVVKRLFVDGTSNLTAIRGFPTVLEVIPSDPGTTFDIGPIGPDKSLAARWGFKQKDGNQWRYYWTCNLGEQGVANQLTNTFSRTGTWEVKVTLIDKDMRKAGDLTWDGSKWTPTTAFSVNVDDFPSTTFEVEVSDRSRISVSPALNPASIDGLDSFVEGDFLSHSLEFTVTLADVDAYIRSDDYGKPLRIALCIGRSGYVSPDLDNLGILTVNSTSNDTINGVTRYYSRIQPYEDSCRFRVSNLDGTPRTVYGDTQFCVWAEVVTDDDVPGKTDSKWNTYYDVRTNYYCYVVNTAPTIDLVETTIGGYSPNTETNRHIVEKNAQLDVKWTVSDVVNDLTNKFQVAVTVSDGQGTQKTYTTTNGEKPSEVNLSEHRITDSWQFAFGSSGNYQVTITAKDKDGGLTRYTWYFTVAAGKSLFLLPHVQDGIHTSGNLEDAKTYLKKAEGIGSGRAWATTNKISGSLFNVDRFSQQWVYQPSVNSATFAAIGYHVGDVEGSLTKPDIDLDTSGNKYKNDDHYAYTDTKLDSFFYRWVGSATEGDDGLSTPNPQADKENHVEGKITLPEQDTDPTRSYDDTFVEAIFSKELHAEDNLGDINSDGIPDKYYFKYMDFTEVGEDLTSAAALNEDEDFFPAAAHQANPLNPTTAGWGQGRPFTFYYEVRGLHEGLNEPGISEYSLSEAETMTLVADWVAATGTNISSLAFADIYIAATNWATRVKWSLERRLNPTMADTDNDDYSDGYEYYFWYYSRVGLMVDGSWRTLTGSKFSTNNERLLGIGVEIPSWAIAYAFDPKHKHSVAGVADEFSKVSAVRQDSTHIRLTYKVGSYEENWTYNINDFDDDGLSDLEEIALGTNPIDWDSDGDGLPDYFELYNGLAPLTPGDANGNPDRDFMARMNSENNFTVITVAENGSDKLGTMYAVDAIETEGFIYGAPLAGSEADYYRIKTANDVEYLIPTNKFDSTIDSHGTRYLSHAVLGYSPITIPGGVGNPDVSGVGAPVDLPMGLGFGANLPTAVERLSKVCITNITLRGAPIMTDNDGNPIPGGVEVFRYGKATGPLVPVSRNGTDKKAFSANNPVIGFRTSTPANEIKLTYIHNQVHRMNGFDPRTAWHRNNLGLVGNRWTKVWPDDPGGHAGAAANTAPYTSLDEFLLLQYRAVIGGASAFSPRYGSYGALMAAYNSGSITLQNVFQEYATRPNIPFEAAEAAAADDSSEENTTPAVQAPSFSSTVHGADTDSDGIPDGWELYVDINPNNGADSSGDPDMDGLSYVQEYAGTDSCYAYAKQGEEGSDDYWPAATDIYANYPGNPDNNGDIHNWYNKFFPTDPDSADTDGDGINDSAESVFKYGSPTDNGDLCIRGGGLNPCTVDTDGDGLPDLWERQFLGWVVSPGDTPEKVFGPGATDLDLQRIISADEFQLSLNDYVEINSNVTVMIRGGMDGTVADAGYDYDHDGLRNFQEYLVQSLRHLRYDDAETPLMGRQLVWDIMTLVEGPFIKFMPMNASDAEEFYTQCREAGFTGGTSFNFRQLGYFVNPLHGWDAHSASLFMFSPQGIGAGATPVDGARMTSSGYATTDPRLWDSDSDGMDDYYELFHGLNPLLGSAFESDDSGTLAKYDLIASIYMLNGLPQITSWRNAWTGWDNAEQPKFDAMRFPWMIGTPDCDADGDGLRNAEEALIVNITSPRPTHTDPTPLWMTDSTSTNNSSYVSQYYSYPLSIATFWSELRIDLGLVETVPYSGSTQKYMYSFEENEGYDTDHDFTPDNLEIVKNVSQVSDPRNAYDPPRRQGIWFSGANSAAITATGTQQRPESVDYDLLRQFTVEAWVKAEDPEAPGDHIILERVSDYSASSLSNDTRIVRANFRLGIRDGKFFGEFDGSTANSQVSTLVGPLATTNWTHLALTFNGSTFALHVNGDPTPYARIEGVQLIPANGIMILRQEAAPVFSFNINPRFPVSESGYDVMPTAFILGAKALNGTAIDLAKKPTWDDYGAFFKGWVSEVRVWDGARSASEISGFYKNTMTFDEMRSNRSEVYRAMLLGNTRNDTLGGGILPAELVQHYNFSSLASAVDEGQVAVEPNGFTRNVADQVRIEGRELDDFGGIYCGWWVSTPVNSTVYRNKNVVPWIANNVAHLPFLDGSTADSQYWSESVAGIITAETAASGVIDEMTASNGVTVGSMDYTKFDFANTAHPYPYYSYSGERYFHWQRLVMMERSGTTNGTYGVNSTLSRMWYFQMRSGFVGTSDLVPLGDAFAKRDASYFDGEGPMDAHELTDADTDGDGLPDWWEALYGDISCNSIVVYGGKKMSASEAYLRDLAKGMLVGGGIDSQYANVADLNKNGILDFWEKMYGIYGLYEAVDDPDNDGLSNYAEYLSTDGVSPYGEANGFPRLDPLHGISRINVEGQMVPDYFMPGPTNKVLIGPDVHGQDRYFDNYSYLGEIFHDHDFMEDWWERGYNASFVSDRKYDPAKDYDGDGWSNWSECRYSMWSGLHMADMVDSWLDATRDIYFKAYPRPAIGIRMTYNGKQDVSGRGIVVRTYSGQTARMDATYVIPGGANPRSVQRVADLYLGRYLENAVLHGFLNPGSLMSGTVNFSASPMSSDQHVEWHYRSGTKTVRGSSTLQYYVENISMLPGANIDVTGLAFQQFATTFSSDGKTGRIVHSLTAADLGTIDYRSGEFALDMAAYARSSTNQTELAAMVFTASYNYQLNYSWPQTIYVSDGEFVSSEGQATSGGNGRLDGFVREGKNTIEVFIDMNGNGAYNPGEPFGVVKNVNVSWHKTDQIDIELTDTSSFMPRYNISTGASDRNAINGTMGGVTSAGGGGDDDSNVGTTGMSKSIRIVRTAINGQNMQKRMLLRKNNIIVADRAYIHEGDVITTGRFDLDWNWLIRDAEKIGISPSSITHATYEIEEIGSLADGSATNMTLATFVNSYGASRPIASPVSPASFSPVYSASPVFSWKCSDDTATAFCIEVRGTNESGVVTYYYNSGLRTLPGRVGLSDGSIGCQTVLSGSDVQSLYVDMAVTNGAPVLVDGANYEWRVALYNAKYRLSESEKDWSAWTPFQMDVRNARRDPLLRTGYGVCAAAVRYYGPDSDYTNAEVSVTNIIVEAYASADFAGKPLARTRANGADGNIRSITDIATTNAVLRGIEPGSVYLMAFIDKNGNGIRDAHESWGYANNVGRDTKYLYTPRAVVVTDSLQVGPDGETVIYIEDTDVNQNEIPDCLEDAFGNSAALGGNDFDADGLADVDEDPNGTDALRWDSDEDGMPDGWEVKFSSINPLGNTDPIIDDGGDCVEGDKMAYEEVDGWLVSFTATSGVTKALILSSISSMYPPSVNHKASEYQLHSYYSYGVERDKDNPSLPLYGLGTNVTVEAEALITNVKTAKVALVHAQLYERYGFEVGVATAFDETHSKPFTNLDKYLVCRYLEAIGYLGANEWVMNANGVNFTEGNMADSDWAKYTVSPNTMDGNLDGIADGWQLYVMFGTNTLGGTNIAYATPWTASTNASEKTSINGLSWIDEYDMRKADANHLPTNPWAEDTDGDGVSDVDAYKFHLKGKLGSAQLLDDDNDGLSNWAEYLAYKLTGKNFDVTNPCSVDTNRLDYFYQVTQDGVTKYIGECIDKEKLGLIADHDFMEDSVEDTLGLPYANRYVYDANSDKDGNGWDNWSDIRARYNEATWVVVGQETNTYTRTFNSFTPEAKAQWKMWYDNEFTPKASYLYGEGKTAWLVSAQYYNVNGEERVVQSGVDYCGPVDDTSCKVIWYELDDRKAYGGKPLPNVNVRIGGVDADVTNVTITAYSDKKLLTPDAVFELEGKTVGGVFTSKFVGDGLKQGLNTFVATSGNKNGFVRGINVGFDHVDVEIALRDDAIAFTIEQQENAKTRVSVIRTAVNGVKLSKQRTVYTKVLALNDDGGRAFTEADFLRSDELDFDYRYLTSDAMKYAGIDPGSISTVEYAVCLDGDTTNAVHTFTRSFDSDGIAPIPSGATEWYGNVVATARPTLMWQSASGYTAFALQISTDEYFTNIVYATTNQMPIATTEGVAFRPEICVGEELKDGTNYYWRVAQLNSKFTTNKWSDPASFRTAVNVDNADTGYGRLAVDVRYFGPATNDLTNVVVGVYESADFACVPIARKRLAGEGTVSSLTNNPAKAFFDVATNVVIDGIAPGKYYVMAFIDKNGNGKRDYWESWGYVNKIDTRDKDIYTPVAFEVVSTKVATPSAILVMEDTDVNQNWIPDCLEDLEGWTLPSDVVPGDGTIDTDGDGMPDGWEDANGTDPLTPDADEYVDGDVMAYYNVSNTLFVAIGVDAATAETYAVMDLEHEPLKLMDSDIPVGFSVTNLVSLYTTYAYGSYTGIGRHVMLTNENLRVWSTWFGTAHLVHAQVYDRFGFNTLTANAQAYDAGIAVNTKPFTNLDKYLVCRYLENIGIDVSEAEMILKKEWRKYTLPVGVIDSDYDDVADGWELYVMFGGNWTANTVLPLQVKTAFDDVKISPFKQSDGKAVAPGETEMTLVQEYDGGFMPTDPWATDTDKDGISDFDAYTFHLKGGDLRDDYDNDMLPNIIEFLVTRGTNALGGATFPSVYAERRISHSYDWDGGDQVVPDYFLPVGKLYLGEMFTDHDFMEAYLETSNEVQTAVGALDSYKYDARLDSDGDGWSNYAELRAFLEKGTKLEDMGLVTNSGSRANLTAAEALALTQDLERRGLVHGEGYNTWVMDDGTYGVAWNEVTNEFREVTAYPGVPVPTVTVRVFYGGGQSVSNFTVKAWAGANTTIAAEAVWTGCTLVNGMLVLTTPTSGALTEGKHTFVVFAEKSSSSGSSSSGSDKVGTWTPGAPYGFTTDVDVGWKQAKFSVGLTDVNASVMRCDLAGMIANNTFDAQASLNDRGVNGYRYYPNKSVDDDKPNNLEPGTNMPSSVSQVRVRIVRHSINGAWRGNYNASTRAYQYATGVVYDGYLNLGENPAFTEDLLMQNSAGAQFDLDWGNISSAASTIGVSASVYSVKYAVVIGEGSVGATTTNNYLATTFVNGFETSRTGTTPRLPSGTLTEPQPTFTWRHDNSIGKAYPAFQLRVYKGSTATAANLIYDSGIRRAPPRDINGLYSWTPDDLHVGEAVGANKVFENNANYCWTVSMLDAKFTTANSNETRRNFRTAVVGGVMSDKGAIEVAVKYFGPVETTANTAALAKLVRVEAFASPDFSGSPAAATYVKSVDALSATNQVAFNASLTGLAAGEWYVRAFIDTNGNRILDPEESWGYGCYVNTDRKDVWTPRAYTIKPGSDKMPEAVVYIEDVDDDNNGLPDSYSGTAASTNAPYIVVVNNTGNVSAFDIYTKLGAGLLELPYVSMLTHFNDDEEISALRLGYAMAMAGVTSVENAIEPIVRITSFSLEQGIDIVVDIPTTINPSSLKATSIDTINVNVKLTLQSADDIGGPWTDETTVSDTFAINTINGKPNKAQLEALNEKIREKTAANPTKFFKVKVEVE